MWIWHHVDYDGVARSSSKLFKRTTGSMDTQVTVGLLGCLRFMVSKTDANLTYTMGEW
jgi:hypothetical protein